MHTYINIIKNFLRYLPLGIGKRSLTLLGRSETVSVGLDKCGEDMKLLLCCEQ